MSSHPVPAHHLKALTLWKEGATDAAREAFDRCLAVPGDHASVLNDYSLMLAELGGPPGSVEICRAAVAAHPGKADLLNNLGIALLADGQVRQSLDAFNAALRLNPRSATAMYNRSFARLLHGDFRGHLADYEARFAGSGLWPTGSAQLDDLPIWMGEPLAGKNLLVHAEQGFGDTLQYCRFIALVAALKPARLTFHVQPEVLPALTGLRRFAELHPVGTVIGPCHYTLPLMSLPHRLGLDWSTLPAWSPYLAPDHDRVAYWRQRLRAAEAEAEAASQAEAQAEAQARGPSSAASASDGQAQPVLLRVGLAWRGASAHARDRERSLALRELQVLAQPGVRFVSLQKGPAAAEARADRVLRPLPLGEELCDFGDTAALISQLDLVISVDTSVAHLAGALGHPTWMLDAGVDPRWLTQREDSPWYPSVRLFRQRQRGDWKAPIVDLAYAMQQLLRERRRADTPTATELSAKAAEMLTEGRIDDAVRQYRHVCDQWPGRADGWLGASRAAEAAGQPDAAVRHARAAILQQPQRSTGFLRLGALLHRQRRPYEALCSYQHALVRDPEQPDTLIGLARLLREQGRPGEGRPHLHQLLRQDPGNVSAMAELAHSQLAGNDPLGALRWAHEALALVPDQPPLQELSARCLQLLADALPQLAPAITAWRTTPGASSAMDLAEALFDAGLPLPAIGFYREALAAAITHHGVRGLSDALIAQSEWTAAARLGELTARHFPQDVDLRSDHATALWKLGDHAGSERLFTDILATAPDHLAALLHGSAVSLALRDGARAQARAERALALAPTATETLLNRAAVAEWMGDDALADRYLLEVLAQDPQHAQARFNRGALALKSGAWARGWADYEARADAEGVRAWLGARGDLAQRWLGEPLDGKHLVVCTEQGLGDTLQALRFLPRLAPFAPARITLQVQDALLPWLRTLAPPVPGVLFEVMPRSVPLPPFQAFVPLLSLPGVLGTRPDSVPAPWLPPVDAARAAFWQRWLAATPGPRIGLCWAGNPEFPRDHERSPGLATVLPLLDGLDRTTTTWVSLVHGPRGAEGSRHGMQVPAWSPALGFADSAALVSTLDLVITSDTSMAHLAAGLGKPTWLLLAKAADWRWAQGDHTPWYPGMRLFRQPHAGDWAAVIEAVGAALRAR